MSRVGHLKLLVGPMCSGKSKFLISHINDDCVVIKSDTDTRRENYIQCHDGFTIKATSVKKLSEVKHVATRILIDEGQFFEDIVDFVKDKISQGHDVVVAALNGDYMQKPFANISVLYSMADQVVPCVSFCACGKIAPFSKRVSSGTERISVNDKYFPVCRKCLTSKL